MPPPDEVTAREKFACPACGAQAEWSPSKQKLICPFCGTESPYQLNPSSGAIEEIDLVKTLRELKRMKLDTLLERRYEKFRNMGVFLEQSLRQAGKAAG